MVEEQEKGNDNSNEKKIQKKSQKDMNGVIGSLICGMFLAVIAYQIYTGLNEFAIAQILACFIGFCALVLWYL